MFENLSAVLDSFIEAGIPGNDCIVRVNGDVAYRRFRGVSDREKGIPMNGAERYNIYSCSKLITVVCALQLYEKGAFRLDDPLAEYMPEFAEMTVRSPDGVRPAEHLITLRQLFTMTAGLDYNTSSSQLNDAFRETEGRCPTRETMKYLARRPLSFEPGAHWQYSFCHDVLAALVELAGGLTAAQAA